MPELDATARVYYSDELISLVYRCLRFNDEERPTPDEVMNEVCNLFSLLLHVTSDMHLTTS